MDEVHFKKKGKGLHVSVAAEMARRRLLEMAAFATPAVMKLAMPSQSAAGGGDGLRGQAGYDPNPCPSICSDGP